MQKVPGPCQAKSDIELFADNLTPNNSALMLTDFCVEKMKALFSRTQKIVKSRVQLSSLDLVNKEILMAQRNQDLSFKYMEFVLRRKHFLTDVAVLTINSETVSFLKTLGCAKKDTPAKKVTLRRQKRPSIKSVATTKISSQWEGSL